MSKYLAVAALFAGSLGMRGQDAEISTLIKAGEQAVRQANYAEADVLYAKAAARGESVEVAPALWYLGTRAAGQGNRLAAEGFFERLLRVDPKGPHAARALTWLGNLRRDDPAGAEALFKQALAMQEAGTVGGLETARSYAFLMRRQGRLDEADAMEKAWGRGVSGSAGARTNDLPPGVYRVGGGVRAPALLYKFEPQYTEEARQAQVQGTVLLSVDIDPNGTALNVEVQRSLEPGLDQKAIDAVRQWRFKPGTKDGAPVTVRATIEVNFRLN
jgi:TonB family protein